MNKRANLCSTRCEKEPSQEPSGREPTPRPETQPPGPLPHPMLSLPPSVLSPLQRPLSVLAPPESRPGRLQSVPLAGPPAFLCGTQGPGLPLQLPCSPPGASLDIQGTWGERGAEMARPGLVHPPSQPLGSSCWSSLPRWALRVCHKAGPWGVTLTVGPWAPGSAPLGTSEGPRARQRCGQRGGAGPCLSPPWVTGRAHSPQPSARASLRCWQCSACFFPFWLFQAELWGLLRPDPLPLYPVVSSSGGEGQPLDW